MAREGAASGGARVQWPSFLRGEAHEILCRMLEADPLRLREKSAKRLRERHFLIEPDRAHARAVAVCARGAASEPPPPDLEAWAITKVDVAIDQLLEADRQAEEDMAPLDDEDGNFPLITDALMLEPDRVRECTVAFNLLGPLPRRAFFEILIEGRQIPDILESGPWDEDLLYEHIHIALAPFGYDLPVTEVPEDGGEEAPNR